MPITLDELARISQDEFTAIRGEMKQGFDRVYEDIGILRKDMESGFSGLAHVLKSIKEDTKEIKRIDLEVFDLQHRMERVEKHLGLSK